MSSVVGNGRAGGDSFRVVALGAVAGAVRECATLETGAVRAVNSRRAALSISPPGPFVCHHLRNTSCAVAVSRLVPSNPPVPRSAAFRPGRRRRRDRTSSTRSCRRSAFAPASVSFPLADFPLRFYRLPRTVSRLRVRPRVSIVILFCRSGFEPER